MKRSFLLAATLKTAFLMGASFLLACGTGNSQPEMASATPPVVNISLKGPGSEIAFPKTFKLTGKLANPQAGGQVYLYAISQGGREDFMTFDVKSDGTFSQEVTIKHPDFFLVNFFNAQESPIIFDGNDLTIEADGSKADGSFTVNGSTENTLFAEYRLMEQRIGEKSNQLREAFYAAEDDQSRQKVETDYEAFRLQTVADLKAFITKAEGAMVSVLPAGMLSEDEDFDLLNQLSEHLAKFYPNTPMITSFRSRIQELGKTAIGQPAPEIELESPQGSKVKLSSLKGKYVLIDFWASWCGPCRQENPNVVRVYNQYKDKGFEIFGVSLDRDRAKWLEAIEKDKLTWVHVSDLQFWNSSVVPQYGIQGIPYTVLLDKEGRIIAKNLRGKALEDKLASLF